jgi:serine/threonine protein kinase
VERYLVSDSAEPTSRAVLACAPRSEALEDRFEATAQRLAVGTPEEGPRILRFGRESTVFWVAYDRSGGKPLSDADVIPQYLGRPFPDGSAAQRTMVTAFGAILVGVRAGTALDLYAKGGFWHGDLSPRAIWVAKDRVAVVETGFRQLFGLDTAPVVADTMYRAPEQLEGGQFDERSDIYSLGLILYSMMIEAAPLDAEEAEEVLRRCREGDPKPLVEVLGDKAYLTLSKVLQGALMPDPKRRTQQWESFWSPLHKLSQVLLRAYPLMQHDSGRRAEATGGTLIAKWRSRYDEKMSGDKRPSGADDPPPVNPPQREPPPVGSPQAEPPQRDPPPAEPVLRDPRMRQRIVWRRLIPRHLSPREQLPEAAPPTERSPAAVAPEPLPEVAPPEGAPPAGPARKPEEPPAKTSSEDGSGVPERLKAHRGKMVCASLLLLAILLGRHHLGARPQEAQSAAFRRPVVLVPADPPRASNRVGPGRKRVLPAPAKAPASDRIEPAPAVQGSADPPKQGSLCGSLMYCGKNKANNQGSSNL